MSAQFNATKTPTARKTHRCEECGRTIGAGEKYARSVGTWEGDFFTNVACAHCAAARKIVGDREPDYWETYFGGLTEWVDDTADEWWSLRLMVCLRRQWRRKDGSLMPIPEVTS